MTTVATSSVATSSNLTEKEQTALYIGGFDKVAFATFFGNAKTGRTDRKALVSTLLGVASKLDIEGDFDWITRKLSRKNGVATSAMAKQLRTRIKEVLDSSVDLTVKSVQKSPTVTSGDADLSKVIDTSGFVTKEDFGIFQADIVSRMEKLADAMTLIASAVAKS